MEPEGASHKKPPGEALLLLASYADSSGSATTQNSDTEESDDSAAVEEEGERGVKGQAVKEDSPPPRPASSFEDTTVARGNSNGNSSAGPGEVDSPGDHQEGSEESLKFTSSESATDGTEAAGEVERVQTPTNQPGNEPRLGDRVQPSGLAAGDAGSQQLQEAEEIEKGREGLLTPSQLTHESSVEPHNVTSSHDMTFMSDISESPSHISLPHIEEGSGRVNPLRSFDCTVRIPYSTYYKPMMYYKPTPLFSSKFLCRYRTLTEVKIRSQSWSVNSIILVGHPYTLVPTGPNFEWPL